MDNISINLTVFFDEPFWVGILEREDQNGLCVCKITFGAEPKDYQVLSLLMKNYYRLRFSPAVTTAVKATHSNPKRLQREVHKQIECKGIGTRSQQALKLQQELMKTERKVISREQKEAEKLRQFEMKQLKKKEKHKGR